MACIPRIQGGRKSKTGKPGFALKKAEGPRTKREMKSNLKTYGVNDYNIIFEEAKKSKDPNRYLLSKGFSQRQINARSALLDLQKGTNIKTINQRLLKIGYSPKEISQINKKLENR